MDEADVKSEQFGQERGAQALPQHRGRWICSSRMKMMTAKQREETKQQTRPSSFKFVQTVWFPETAPAQKGVQNCHSFEQRAAPRAHCDAGFVLEC